MEENLKTKYGDKPYKDGYNDGYQDGLYSRIWKASYDDSKIDEKNEYYKGYRDGYYDGVSDLAKSYEEDVNAHERRRQGKHANPKHTRKYDGE